MHSSTTNTPNMTQLSKTPAQSNIRNTLYGSTCSTTQLQRTATYSISAMNRRDRIVRSLGTEKDNLRHHVLPSSQPVQETTMQEEYIQDTCTRKKEDYAETVKS